MHVRGVTTERSIPDAPRTSHAAAPMMSVVRSVWREDLNFLLTNRIPRRLATRAVAWLSGIENRAFTHCAIAVWSYFAGNLHLEEAETQRFRSVRECFTRRLRAGARPVDAAPDVLVSPCDALVGACGRVERDTLLQAKGLTYSLRELLHDDELAERHEGSQFATLRLTASMYHRFHAPARATLRRVRYINGDTWNVNPIAVARIARLFCRNERVVLDFAVRAIEAAPGDADAPHSLTLVPVAAILVAGIRVHAVPNLFTLGYAGVDVTECDAPFEKGDEIGYFENGSTIIVLASGGYELAETVRPGRMIRAGERLFRQRMAALPARHSPHSVIPS